MPSKRHRAWSRMPSKPHQARFDARGDYTNHDASLMPDAGQTTPRTTHRRTHMHCGHPRAGSCSWRSCPWVTQWQTIQPCTEPSATPCAGRIVLPLPGHVLADLRSRARAWSFQCPLRTPSPSPVNRLVEAVANWRIRRPHTHTHIIHIIDNNSIVIYYYNTSTTKSTRATVHSLRNPRLFVGGSRSYQYSPNRLLSELKPEHSGGRHVQCHLAMVTKGGLLVPAYHLT